MDVLVRAGFAVASEGARRVVLTPRGGIPQTFNLVVRKQPPRPSNVTAPAPGRWLLYAPEISPLVGAALSNAGWSWLSDDACDLRADAWEHRVMDASQPEEARPLRPIRRGRPASTTWSIVRSLAMSPEPLRQIELAARAGATQGRVSQVMKTLVADGLAVRDRRGWCSRDRRRLATWFLDHYPGPGGVQSWWFHLDPLLVQVASLTDNDPSLVVSGDAAADQLAPWRSPTHAVMYSPALVDLRAAGFVPADGPADGSLLLVAVPSDTSLFAGEGLADPLQIAYDLRRLGGADRAEAAERVLGAALRP
jgi:hypothetical protein